MATTRKGRQVQNTSQTSFLDLLDLPPRPREVQIAQDTQLALVLSPDLETPRPQTITADVVSDEPGFPPQLTIRLRYETDASPPQAAQEQEALYQPWGAHPLRFPELCHPHPAKLVEAAPMVSITPPVPTYQPVLPPHILEQGLLSEAQLATLVYAGQAHQTDLGRFRVADDRRLDLAPCPHDPEQSCGCPAYRQGFFLGDGTGCGKGRQIAGILLDNWLQGRRKAVWFSKSAALLQDTVRDCTALGFPKDKILSLGSLSLQEPIPLDEGILFATYATLRGVSRRGHQTRYDQLCQWLGDAFDGVVVFDEAHALANANPGNANGATEVLAQTGSNPQFGARQASTQGRLGLQLQNDLPQARVLYVSATGATEVENLAYAARLGLWLNPAYGFESRDDFVSSMQRGGVAALEVVARDLKRVGLYVARNLAYDGVKFDPLVHELTSEQTTIYDTYAEAYQVIHQNLEQALTITRIARQDANGALKSCNGLKMGQAKSAFESYKQRFFAHLLCAMKIPSLLRAVQTDLEAGRSVLVQLVTTGEAVCQRRLAQLTPEELQSSDLDIDLTPREYIMDYLQNAFPVQQYQTMMDDQGREYSEPLHDENGKPVLNDEAVAIREALITKVLMLAPVQGTLDQIVHHLGHQQVAEITGRSVRLVRNAQGKMVLDRRPSNANLAETEAFMRGEKRVLVFSDAGGTGRSYHSDLACANQQPRVHYLLEPGWRADTAIQGLGRSHRTNQASPPVFRPVTTDVKGERRFISTIARRLASLGALTKGERQAAGGGLFRPEDSLENLYAQRALQTMVTRLVDDQPETSARLARLTGLRFVDGRTSKTVYPALKVFLNRLLALKLEDQNQFFGLLEEYLAKEVARAKDLGTYDQGVDYIRCEQASLKARYAIPEHPHSAWVVVELTRRVKLSSFEDVMKAGVSFFVQHRTSGRLGAVRIVHKTEADGRVIPCYRLAGVRYSELLTENPRNERGPWEQLNDLSQAQELWAEAYQRTPAVETFTAHMIVGALLGLWKRLPSTHQKIWRLTCSDGEGLLGRVLDGGDVFEFAKSLGVQLDAEVGAAAILRKLRQARDSLFSQELCPGVRLRRRPGPTLTLELKHRDTALRDALVQAGSALVYEPNALAAVSVRLPLEKLPSIAKVLWHHLDR